MSELTKNQLKQDNQNSFPNNNTGYITPAILRDFNINMIDSLVDEVSYGADSASFNARINALDPSGSAASLLALEQATGSLNAYTASQNLFNSSATASIVALQSFSSSLDATFATDAQLTALSTSIAVTDLAQSQSIAALQSFSSSLDATFATDAQLSASVAALSSSVAVTDNAQSASIAALQSFSSSLDATFATDAQLSASVSSLSSSVAVTDLAQSASIAALQQFSSSLDATFATDAQLSASVAALSSSVAVTTNSLSSSIGNLSSSIAVTDLAQSASIAALQQFSSSLDATFATDAQLSASASTLQNNINSKLDSASFNSYTQSNDTKWNNLGNQSGSFITESETGSMSVASASFATTASFALNVSGFDSSSLVTSASFNAYTQSNDSKVNSIINKTGSFATTGSNTFVGQQNFNGDVVVNSTIQVNPSNKLYVRFIEANNPNGIEIDPQGAPLRINAVTTLTGSLLVTGSAGQGAITASNGFRGDLTGTASFATTASFALNATTTDTSSLVSTSSFNSYTASASTAVSGAINSATQSLSSSIAVTTNNLDLEVNQKLDSASFNSYTQSNDSKVNSLINATSSYVTEAESGSFVTSVVAGGTPKEITVTKGNGTTNTITVNNVDSASFATTASFALNSTTIDTSSFVTTSSFNQYTQSAASSVSQSINAATQSLSSSIAVTTNLLDLEVNEKLNTSSFNAYTQSNDGKVDSLISKTGSYATTGSNTFNGSQSITGSVSLTGTLTALSASITYLETIFETASVIYSSGSNQLGDELSDVQTLSGSVLVEGLLRVNGVAPILVGQTASYASASISASYAQTASFALNVTPTDVSMFLSKSIFDTYTGSAALGVSQSINAATQSLSSSITVTTDNLDSKINGKLNTSSFNSYTQSNDSKVDSLIAATSSYAISSSVATITGNSLVTASVVGNTITFTKGNGNTFPISVDTGSLPSGLVSSSQQITDFGFATTSSVNSLSQSVAVTTNGLDLEVNQKLDSSSFNSYTQSNDSKVNSLIAATGSYAISSSVAQITSASQGQIDSLISATGSYITSAQTASMTVLSASFAQTASFLLGSVASASFATSASFAETASEARNVVLIARNQNASTLPAGTLVHIVDAVGDNPIFNTASFDTEVLSANTLGMLRTSAASGADVEVLVNGIVTGVNTDPALGYVAGDILYLSSSGQFTRVQPQAPKQIVTIGQVLRAQQNNGSVYVNITNGWELDELHNVAINGVADGDLLVYRSAESLWTNSSSIELGLATTGSNSFVGNENITGSLLVRSGSIYSISNNTTLNPQLYYTASEAGFANIVRGFDDDLDAGGNGSNQANFTARPRVTGSNNILTAVQVIPTTFPGGTAEMTGYISGSGNIILSGRGGMYLNSGSQLLPKTTANQIGLNGRIMMNFTTSSLSGGHPVVNQNILQGGSIVLNHPSGSVNAVGNLQMTGTISSSQAFVTNVRPTIITNSLLGNTINLRHISSSIAFSQNITNAPLTIENHVSSSGIANNNIVVTANAILGGSSNTGHNIYVSGSQNSNAARNIIDNIIGGKNIIVSSSFVSSSNSNLLASLIYGQNLIVSGNHGTAGGSTFVGRNNDSASGLANAQDIVFAVGTGTNTASRKTGLWIDSGSLTTINGGLYVTQSQVTLTNSGSTPSTLALAIRSGSVEVTSPQGNGYFYTNLPITSSNLRINGDGIISDLFVSGVFSGNSTLRVLGNSSFTGSVFTSASVNGVVNPLSISSQTASLDFSKGNFFTIQLVSGSATHINPTNIAAGQTISLRLNTTGSGTVTFASSIKQASGSAYTPTTTTGVDVITLISFDTSNVYISNLKNFN